ncbi:MAG: glycoside hydrolase family 32 protein, partial [Chloroflexi bacterium]|nr:glycoside hydrolase family 32 protein [Chloroflexota bacterium]
NPDDVIWGPMHWGHAVSTDLVHWETLPICALPGRPGHYLLRIHCHRYSTTPRVLAKMPWSPSIHTIHRRRTGLQPGSWPHRTKYDGNPIIDALYQDFRDPKVFWHEPTGRWVMIISAGRRLRSSPRPT